MNPLEFHWEFRQNERLNSLLKEVNRLKSVAEPIKLRPAETPVAPSPAGNAELEHLRFEVSELKLFIAVLVQILETKGIANPGEFIETLEHIASELRPAASSNQNG